MTLHISYEHKCNQCGTDYIPFDADVPCPKCGLVESERYDFIGAAVRSTLYNLERYGSYQPAQLRKGCRLYCGSLSRPRPRVNRVSGDIG